MNQRMVDAIVDIFRQKEVFRFALAPEGTRKKVDELRSGFYYIAKEAGVPLVMVAFDFGKKQVVIAEPFMTSEDFEADMKEIRHFYKDVRGKIPEYSFY